MGIPLSMCTGRRDRVQLPVLFAAVESVLGRYAGRTVQRGLEDGPETQKFLQPRRLADILAGPQPFGIRHIPFCIGRTEDDDGDFTALGALPHAFQHVLSGSFRQVQVDDGEVRAIELIGRQSLR